MKLKVNVFDQLQISESCETLKMAKQEESLSKVSSSVVDLLSHSNREQIKSLLTYLAKNEHVQIDDKRMKF